MVSQPGSVGTQAVESVESTIGLATPARTRRAGAALDQNPRWAQALIYLILIALTLITVLPMVNILARSLSAAHGIVEHPMMLLPRGLTFEAYRYIFETPVLMRSFGITVFATVVGTFLNLLFTTMAAYGLSKTYLPGHRILMWLVILPMLFSAGLIPLYIQIKNIHLLNSIWVLVIWNLISPFNVILMRNFFWSIHPDLEDSARMDGASDVQVLLHVVLPLSKPVLATVGLFYAVGHWNDFFTGLFFISDSSKWPLQVVLRSIIIDQSMLNMGSSNSPSNDITQMIVSADNIRAATTIFAIVPILLVYPFLQRYFVKGIMLGSVKG